MCMCVGRGRRDLRPRRLGAAAAQDGGAQRGRGGQYKNTLYTITYYNI